MMSKSLGNFFTVRDLLEQGVPGEVIRFVLLGTHYGKPMDWTAEKADDARRELYRWRESLTGVAASKPSETVVDILKDDLNVAGVFAELRALFLRWMNAKSIAGDADAVEATFLASANLLGLLTQELGGWFRRDFDFSWHIDRFHELRDFARDNRDYSALDAYRGALVAAGVDVRMSKGGVELVPGPNFDPAKLGVLT